MPGMLDTILNLGLTESSVEGLARRTGHGRFAWDSRRRLVQMFSEVVKGVDAMAFENALTEARQAGNVTVDSDLDETALRALWSSASSASTPDQTGRTSPRIRRSSFAWRSKPCSIPGTTSARSPTGGSTASRTTSARRSLSSGWSSGTLARAQEPESRSPGTRPTEVLRPDGDFLVNAQGEDVVAGVRNTEDLDGLARRMPEIHAELLESLSRLERHYRDIQDVEYTVEEGRLFILQTRSAKRHALAAVRFAVDAVADGLLDREEALRRIDPGSLGALLHPSFDPADSPEELTRGVPASPGAAQGQIVLSAGEAEAQAAAGEDVILVRPFTSADDVGGFHAARGILTALGGKSSHAAIVARGMGRPCVCGATALEIDPVGTELRIGDQVLHPGDVIAIDGYSGVVTADEVRLIPPQVGAAFAEVLAWSDELRRLGVRANADTRRGRRAGPRAGGRGHRPVPDRAHVLRPRSRAARARDVHRRRACARGARGPRSRDPRDRPHKNSPDPWSGSASFSERTSSRSSAAMRGLPVTIRLLDPPIHEFIEVASFERDLAEAEGADDADAVEGARTRLEIARDLEETNPMLGTRGARLGLRAARPLRDAGAGGGRGRARGPPGATRRRSRSCCR